MRRLAVCLTTLIAACAVLPVSAQEEGDRPLEVHVYPPGFERRAAALEEFLASEGYAHRRHAELSLAVAQDLFAAADYDAAEELLEETADHLEEEGAEGTVAMASLYDAMASLDEVDGNVGGRLGNLWRARGALAVALGERHPVAYLATLRVHNAYLEAAAAGIRSYNRGVALRRLKNLIAEAGGHLGEAHYVTLLAELSLARYDIARGHESDALERLRDIVRRAEAAGQANSPAIALALLLEARLHRERRDEEAMERAVATLAARLPEGSEPVLLFEMDDKDAVRQAADSERDYLMQISGGVAGPFPVTVNGEGFRDPLQPFSDVSGSRGDISFCVDQDGQVSEVTVHEVEGRRSPEEWRRRVEEIVKARRYTPAPGKGAEEACIPRYERITLTSDSIAIASRIRRKSSRTYIVRHDLLDQELGGGYLKMISAPAPTANQGEAPSE